MVLGLTAREGGQARRDGPAAGPAAPGAAVAIAAADRQAAARGGDALAHAPQAEADPFRLAARRAVVAYPRQDLAAVGARDGDLDAAGAAVAHGVVQALLDHPVDRLADLVGQRQVLIVRNPHAEGDAG